MLQHSICHMLAKGHGSPVPTKPDTPNQGPYRAWLEITCNQDVCAEQRTTRLCYQGIQTNLRPKPKHTEQKTNSHKRNLRPKHLKTQRRKQTHTTKISSLKPEHVAQKTNSHIKNLRPKTHSRNAKDKVTRQKSPAENRHTRRRKQTHATVISN